MTNMKITITEKEESDLTFDYIDNLPLFIKKPYEDSVFNAIERFAYTSYNKTLLFPKKPNCAQNDKSLGWIITSINHEYLHYILDITEGHIVSSLLDNFSYADLVSGNINDRISELENKLSTR